MSFDLKDLVGDFVEEFGLPGVAIGVGAIVLAPVLGPPLAKLGKPAAKLAIKTGLVVYDKGKTLWSEAGEALEDLVAETRAELAEVQAKKALAPVESSPDAL
ncbi:DUF5132 domain-containing protein [Oxynema sp. CENA135]|uniref:DUF5132 domain-containing protein n=1 Tax=Oxynema sp. CENA135 TaxID=984206 RepID=UPI00190CE8F3|nr:DUF5132 domain-containing protein [Oxynema sp. CENA135]MBK4729478.1 DUF5132 domain-containing protein [Oxynema sp. CENA135]